MAMTQSDLDAAITNFQTAVTAWKTNTDTLLSTVTTAFNSLLQKIAAAGGTATPIDFTTEVTAINTSIATINAETTKVISAIATASVTGK
jgi:hypothetical protein